MDHLVSCVSSLFHGSQINWAALTKEAYAIYTCVKKSTFYITGHEITLRSDHLPLKKFLRKMTLNDTVNNWSTKIESFNINFVHISGKDCCVTVVCTYHARPVVFQQTRVPNSLPMGANYVDYEPQGTEVIQVCLQTTT